MYEPGPFSRTYEDKNGEEIWNFLNENDNIVRMETAAYLGKPAVAPLSEGLAERFEIGKDVDKDRIKQMIGHMVRQIMERQGYEIIYKGDAQIKIEGNIFSSGARYKRRKNSRDTSYKGI